MLRRNFTAGLAGVAGLGAISAVPQPVQAAGISAGDAALGVRAALERGAGAAVDLLGRSGGFIDNPRVRIELPGYLKEAAKLLKYTGQQHRVDELVTAMNRAAEAAVPAAKGLLVGAVKAMSVEDAKQIIMGSDTAATQFFVAKTRAPLTVTLLPIVTQATQKASLAEKYNAVAGKAVDMGLVGKDDAKIEHYVTGKTLDGLYLMIAEEERKIRKDPLGTGSAILAKVFGSLK